jgi:hypothetical protein
MSTSTMSYNLPSSLHLNPTGFARLFPPPMLVPANLNDTMPLITNMVATQIDMPSMSLLFRFSTMGVFLMSLGFFIFRYRYPCITIHRLDDSISHARDALVRCREEGVLATVWGKYEVDLLKYVHI